MTLPSGFDGPHIRTEDDPLGEGPICSGCKGDWPCDYVQGYRAAQAADAVPVDAERLARALRELSPWKDDLAFEDVWAREAEQIIGLLRLFALSPSDR
jgi:hypothetical protein